MPTAADMAQLGSEIIAGHRTRSGEVADLRAAVRAEMRGIHRLNKAHKAATVHMLGEFQEMDKDRRRGAREHAKETRQFVGQLHRATGRRKAAVAGMISEFQREDAARQEAMQEHAAQVREQMSGIAAEIQEHAAQVREQMSGYAAEMKGAHNEWGRQMKASAAATKTASGRRSR